MTIAVAFLQSGWADWEAGSVLAYLREYCGVQVEIATPDGEPQTSIGGVLAASDYRFDDPVLSDADVFLLIGSDGHAPDYLGIEAYVDTPKAVTDGKVVTASGLAPITFSAAIGRLVAPEMGEKHDEYLAMFAREFAA
jgi:hypothetical protein